MLSAASSCIKCHILPISGSLHVLQLLHCLFEFHKVGRFYQNGIARLHIILQMLHEAVSVLFIDHLQRWIYAGSFFCHVPAQRSGTDQYIDAAFSGMFSNFFMQAVLSLARQVLPYLPTQRLFVPAPSFSTSRDAFMDIGLAL